MTDVKRLLDEATPLPWELRDRAGEMGAMVVSQPKDSGKRDKIVLFPGATEREWQVAHAALIVYAVNRLPDYEAAVDALESWMERPSYHGDGCYIRSDLQSCDCGIQEIRIAARAALARLRGKVAA